jgi:hypothetical protein
MMDLIYKPDVTMIKKFIKDEEQGKKEEQHVGEDSEALFIETDKR